MIYKVGDKVRTITKEFDHVALVSKTLHSGGTNTILRIEPHSSRRTRLIIGSGENDWLWDDEVELYSMGRIINSGGNVC